MRVVCCTCLLTFGLAAAAAVSPEAAAPAAISGITKPMHEAMLSLSVPGTVMKLCVQEGAAVTTGQPLLELDRLQEELEVTRRKLLWENRAELQAAIARVATLKADLESTRRVYESTKTVSKDELNKKQLEYDVAVAEQQRVEMVEQREKIEHEMALEALARRTLKAPFAGRITDIKVEEGEGCEMHQPVMKLVDVSRCYFVANVEAALLLTLQTNQTVEIVIDGTAAVVRGTLAYLAPVVDAGSGLGEVKAVFANPDGAVRPGVGASLRTAAARRGQP